MKYELKKFFSKMTNKLILTAMILVAVIFSFLAVDSMSYTDMGGELATGFGKLTAGRRIVAGKNKWKGELTPEKIADAVESYHKPEQSYPTGIPNTESEEFDPPYLDILYFAANIYQTESDVARADLARLAEEDLEHIYDTYADNLQNWAKEYGKTPEQEKFLSEQYQKIEIPVIYEAYDSWETMATYAEMYILILVVVIGFMAAGIFDEEFRNHAERVFFTTKYGRSKAVRNKIAVGMLATTIVYWVGIGILSLISFGIIGESGFNTPYQIADPYNMYAVTQGQYYLLIVVCGYIASLLSAAVTMLVTARMHTEKVAIFIPVFMYWLLLFIGNRLAGVTNLAYLTTAMLVNIDNAIKYPVLFQIGNAVVRPIPSVMVLYAAVSVILLPFIYKSYSGYDSAKNPRRESQNRSGVAIRL